MLIKYSKKTPKKTNPVPSASLARCIKSLLKLAGIDTGIFSAHSLRGAATSAAFNRGVSISEILNMADRNPPYALLLWDVIFFALFRSFTKRRRADAGQRTV